MANMKHIKHSILVMTLCLLFANTNAFAQADANAVIKELDSSFATLYQSYLDGKITIVQWKKQAQAYCDKALKDGLIDQNVYEEARALLENQFNELIKMQINQYQNLSGHNYQACLSGNISPMNFISQQNAALKVLYEGEIIDIEEYNSAIVSLEKPFQICMQTQDAQRSAESQTLAFQGQPMPEDLQAKRDAVQKLLESIQKENDKCKTNQTTPEQYQKNIKTLVDTEYNKGMLEQADYDMFISETLPNLVNQCSHFHDFFVTVQDCFDQYGPTEQYRDCQSTEMDKLIAFNLITPENKDENLKEIDELIATYKHLNPDRNKIFPKYQEEYNRWNEYALEGIISAEEFNDKSRALLYEMRDLNILTNEEYSNMQSQISSQTDYIEDMRQVWKENVSSYTTGTTTFIEWDGGYHLAERILRDREGFEFKLGFTAGVILDEPCTASLNSPVKDLDVSTFMEGRDLDGVDYLSQFGLTFAIGYTFNWFTFYVQQEFGYGPWLGDAGDKMDPQILMASFGVFRFGLPFWASRFQLSFDLGLGAAYSGGDERSKRTKSGYTRPYIFDKTLGPGVAFAAKIGFAFDWYITPTFSIGLKFDYDFITNNDVSLEADFDRYIVWSNPQLGHDMHFWQPGIQMTWTVPTPLLEKARCPTLATNPFR